jgi:hypothetical protein
MHTTKEIQGIAGTKTGTLSSFSRAYLAERNCNAWIELWNMNVKSARISFRTLADG